MTDTNPIYYQDATALAALIRTRQLSSREVVQTHLDRIGAVNPQINAVVTLIAEDALKGADIADKAIADGAALGPRHGIPFSIKDSLDTAGVLTQRGSKLFAGNIPDRDATAVARRTPGGSSGGESAALAAGMSPIGIGSDVMISLRGPAAFTGIAALKATHGRVPYTGHYPSILSHWWHVGAMARTIGDVALGYSILKGPDGIDGYAIHARDAEPDSDRVAGEPIRVAWVSDAAFGPVDPEITAAVTAAAAQLADLGYEVEEVTLLSWVVLDPRIRTISPFSNITVSEWIETRIGEGTFGGLRTAVQVDPANARLAAHFGSRLAAYAGQEEDSDYIRRAQAEADYQTRRAVKLLRTITRLRSCVPK